jgi:hypothetical protein
MILLYGLLYFGYATLGRQRQDKATAYAAWQSGTQDAGPLVNQFWAWNGQFNTGASVSFDWTSASADTTFSVYGGGANGESEWVRQGDEYYGMTINGTVPIPTQYQIPGYSGGGGDLFDRERVAVDLWNYALGAVWQSFTWTAGVGLAQQFPTNPTDFYQYLNMGSPANQEPGGGLLLADRGDPPTPALASSSSWPQGCGGLVAAALSVPMGAPGGAQQQQWLQRRAVESTMNYRPPFLGTFWGDQSATATTNFSQYVSLSYPEPTNPPTTATTDCDVTTRNTDPSSARAAVGEGGQTSDMILDEVAEFFGQSPLAAPPADITVLDASGDSIQTLESPKEQ